MSNDEFDEKGKQIAFRLGWSVVACEDEKIDQNLLLPYFDPVPKFNEKGEKVGEDPVLDLTNKIQHWAGKRWMY